jgi:hypothetical protein
MLLSLTFPTLSSTQENRTMSEITLNGMDGLYIQLREAQDQTMRVLGDKDGQKVYSLIGEAMAEAERVAPPGWSVVDLGLLPRLRGGYPGEPE